jgi:trehalose 6-phosphate phosphatase
MWETSLDEAMQMEPESSLESADLPSADRIDLNRTALLLDVDGTLIDIAERPDDAVVPHSLCVTLQELLARTGGAVALVSGRTIAALDRLFRPLLMPAVGQHGAEMRISPNAPLICSPASLSQTLRTKIQQLAQLDRRILVEEKSNALAVHYRLVPQREHFLKREVQRATAGETDPDSVEIMFGKAVIDIKPKLFNKGSAVREIMASAPFAGRRLVFVGDDTTDESVFAILPELNGIGYSVGRRVKGTQGTFAAPAEVRSWLSHIASTARA